MSLTANRSYPTAIRFGAGRIAEIADACAAAGTSKPLLITDRNLADMDITWGLSGRLSLVQRMAVESPS